MIASNVIPMSSYRQRLEMYRRFSQSTVTLAAAIHDGRINREDLKLLSDLMEQWAIHERMRLPYAPENPIVTRSLNKLKQAGYITGDEVQDLLVGFRRDTEKTLKPFWILSLSEREVARAWR